MKPSKIIDTLETYHLFVTGEPLHLQRCSHHEQVGDVMENPFQSLLGLESVGNLAGVLLLLSGQR